MNEHCVAPAEHHNKKALAKEVPSDKARPDSRAASPSLPAADLAQLAYPAGRLQAVRHEEKYAATPMQADIIREKTLQQLRPDDFTLNVVGTGYAILTLNLDSPDLGAFRAGEKKVKNIDKLRIRQYGDAPTTAFLEVKGKRNGQTVKLRALVTTEAVDRYLRNWRDLPTTRDLVSSNPKEVAALERFNELAHATLAEPKTFNACRREGFEPEVGNDARITIDHQLRVSPYLGGTTPPPEEHWRDLQSLRERGLSVVIEFKYVGEQMPTWMTDAIQAAGIGEQHFSSKYRSSVKEVLKPPRMAA
jgi:hypothetical protein